jgi:hypothetical protein
MSTTFRQVAWFAITWMAGAALGAGALGCDESCDAFATCLPDGWTGNSTGTGTSGRCPEDPAEGPVSEECGVWVSAIHGHDDNPGTHAAPKQTIAAAIDRARNGPAYSMRVYACGETYSEPVVVPAGVSLFGGFDCDNGWAYVGLSNLSRRATIAPPSGAIALTMDEALEGDHPSRVGDLVARSADAEVLGGSSIAVLVKDKARGSFVRSDIFAGNGADGADGDSHVGYPAKDGLNGEYGWDACTINPGPGGKAVQLDCGDGTWTKSGGGGDGAEGSAGNGTDGYPLPSPNPSGFGLGGVGQSGAATCMVGIGGLQGASGEDGVPDSAVQRVTSEGKIVGGDGGDGKPGKPGQGGGGGGASRGVGVCGGIGAPGGAGGGAGGTGGCGGPGARGGQAGGSSLGLLLRGDGFYFSDLRITTGKGGNGGNGGQAKPGGKGGLPGAGGKGFGGPNGIQSGCAGGAGGQGGMGGNGAGGRGGHSLAAALVGFTNAKLEGTSETHPGQSGSGGDGGNPALTGLRGHDGVATPNAIFDP